MVPMPPIPEPTRTPVRSRSSSVLGSAPASAMACAYSTSRPLIRFVAGSTKPKGGLLSKAATRRTPACRMASRRSARAGPADRTMAIVRTADGLTIADPGADPRPLEREAGEMWFVPGSPRYRYVVERDADGRVAAILQRREAWDLRWRRLA